MIPLKIRLCLIIGLWALPLASHAAPALSPFVHAGEYRFSWSGLSLGRIGMEVKEDASNYTMTVDVKATGLFKMFTKHKSLTTVTGEVKNNTYAPQHYHTRYQTKKKVKEITLVYSAAGDVTESYVPADRAKDRPVITTEQKRGAFDPLSAMMRLRRATFDALQRQEKTFSLPLYEGRQLSILNITLYGREKQKSDETLVHVGIRRTPVAGYDAKELKQAKDEPELHLYFSDDARMVPIALSMRLYGGWVEARAGKDCTSLAECLK